MRWAGVVIFVDPGNRFRETQVQGYLKGRVRVETQAMGPLVLPHPHTQGNPGRMGARNRKERAKGEYKIRVVIYIIIFFKTSVLVCRIVDSLFPPLFSRLAIR